MILERICKKAPVPDETISSLAYDTVYNDDKFVFFDDVENGLIILKQKYKLGILSDTWPSLERVFRNKGLRDYFSCFVMLSVHGITKSNPRLFRVALDELGVEPESVLFVDNSEANLTMAKRVGMLPVKICRYKDKSMNKSRFPVIGSLDDLISLLGQGS
jgi:putative hydrolase of the HAD superfamily